MTQHIIRMELQFVGRPLRPEVQEEGQQDYLPAFNRETLLRHLVPHKQRYPTKQKTNGCKPHYYLYMLYVIPSFIPFTTCSTLCLEFGFPPANGHLYLYLPMLAFPYFTLCAH